MRVLTPSAAGWESRDISCGHQQVEGDRAWLLVVFMAIYKAMHLSTTNGISKSGTDPTFARQNVSGFSIQLSPRP